ncbi:MAG: hypothetical protein IKS41_07080 [Alphaproteobacteria bacterium]|nr:hypothetical protein [Alphaproteobacteria bacterium]
MATVNYEELAKEHNEKAQAESAAKLGEGSVLREGDVVPTPEVKDTTKAVDPTTGKVDEGSVPRDPNTNPGSSGQPPRTPQPQNAPQPPQPQAQGGPKPLVNSVIVSASEFEGKGKSFLNPDAEDNFWKTLEGKLKEALSGNTADEIGQNMALGSIAFIFEAISNWAVHHRKEAKRLKKEYEEKTKGFDDVLKNTLVEKYGAVAEFAIKHGINVNTEEGRKKLETLKNNKEFLGLCAGALSATLMREVRLDEAGKLLEGTTKSLSKGNLALNSQEVANALGTQAAQDNAAYWDKKAKGQKVKVQNIHQYREAIRDARNNPNNRNKQDAEIRREVLER